MQRQVATNCFMHGCRVSLRSGAHLSGLWDRSHQSLPSKTYPFRLALIKAAICPWRSHSFFFFFGQVLACSQKGPCDSWPENQEESRWRGRFLGKVLLFVKREYLSVGPFLLGLDTGVKCDIRCSGSAQGTMRQQGQDWRPAC